MKLLILFLLLTQSVFAQESSVFPEDTSDFSRSYDKSQNKSQAEISESLGDVLMDTVGVVVVDSIIKGIQKYTPGKTEFNDIKAQHWLAVTFGVEGVTFPRLQNTTLPSLNIGAELFLGKGFYFYSKIGTYMTLPDHRLYNKIDYGAGMNIVVGFGGYIYNDRSWMTGQGWSIMLNGGVAYRIALGSPLENTQPGESPKYTIPIFHNIGFELNMKFNYNFFQFLGISFGPYFAYYAYEQHAISYGITFGLIL